MLGWFVASGCVTLPLFGTELFWSCANPIMVNFKQFPDKWTLGSGALCCGNPLWRRNACTAITAFTCGRASIYLIWDRKLKWELWSLLRPTSFWLSLVSIFSQICSLVLFRCLLFGCGHLCLLFDWKCVDFPCWEKSSRWYRGHFNQDANCHEASDALRMLNECRSWLCNCWRTENVPFSQQSNQWTSESSVFIMPTFNFIGVIEE